GVEKRGNASREIQRLVTAHRLPPFFTSPPQALVPSLSSEGRWRPVHVQGYDAQGNVPKDTIPTWDAIKEQRSPLPSSSLSLDGPAPTIEPAPSSTTPTPSKAPDPIVNSSPPPAAISTIELQGLEQLRLEQRRQDFAIL